MKCGKVKPKLSPEEWDFRAITEEQLPLAIHYEYARESKWAIEQIQAYWAQRVDPGQFHKFRFPLSAGVTVKKVIDLCAKNGCAEPFYFPDDPPCPSAELANLKLAPIAFNLLAFPKPFLSILANDPKTIADAVSFFKTYLPNCGIIDCTNQLMSGLQQEVESSSHPPDVSLKWIRLNWGFVNRELVEEFRSLLQKWRPPEKKSKKGTAARLPFDWLKQLAAYRLNRVGFRFDVKDKLQAMSPGTFQNPNDVLPSYGSATAWSDAIEGAEKHLKDLFASS